MGNKIISYHFPQMGGFNMKEGRMMMTTLIYVCYDYSFLNALLKT